MDEPPWGITYMSRVHLNVACLSCDFQTYDYVHGEHAAEEHHRETGHELEGEMGLAVYVGEKGTGQLKEQARRLLGDDIVDS